MKSYLILVQAQANDHNQAVSLMKIEVTIFIEMKDISIKVINIPCQIAKNIKCIPIHILAITTEMVMRIQMLTMVTMLAIKMYINMKIDLANSEKEEANIMTNLNFIIIMLILDTMKTSE